MEYEIAKLRGDADLVVLLANQVRQVLTFRSFCSPLSLCVESLIETRITATTQRTQL